MKGIDVSIPAGKIVYINFKEKVGYLKDKKMTMFQSDGIELPEGMHSLKLCKSQVSTITSE